MRIYLDNCCYNRPYDDQGQLKINLESQAKLSIQGQIRDGKYELVTSEMLHFEIHNSPFVAQKSLIADFIEKNSSIHVGADWNDRVDEKAAEIMKTGVKYKDACHVASAIFAECEYFLTTDTRLLRYQTAEITLRNPVDFVLEMENRDE